MKSFWDCDRLFFEDLPTVRDLIWNADWDILSGEVAGLYGPAGDDAQALSVRMALEEMMGLDARDPSGKWVFLPFERYSACGAPGTMERRVDAALLRRRDFKTIEELSAREELLGSARECSQALRRDCGHLGEKYPNLYSWTVRPWGKVLAYRVWMQGDYSRKERYQVLAEIVSDMMLYGETWEAARTEQRLMKRRMKSELKAARSDKVRSSPVELLLRNYGLESSTDDYESEYDARLQDAVLVLNYNASVDLHRRVADLVRRSKRAEKQNPRMKARSLDSW